MPSYKAPVADALFLLNDVLRIGDHGDLAGFSEASPDIVAAVLEEAAKLAEEQLQPLNLPGDQEGCRRAGRRLGDAPKGSRRPSTPMPAAAGSACLRSRIWRPGPALCAAGAVNEFFSSANMAFAMYPGLTSGAVAALLTHGSDELKRPMRRK